MGGVEGRCACKLLILGFNWISSRFSLWWKRPTGLTSRSLCGLNPRWPISPPPAPTPHTPPTHTESGRTMFCAHIQRQKHTLEAQINSQCLFQITGTSTPTPFPHPPFLEFAKRNSLNHPAFRHPIYIQMLDIWYLHFHVCAWREVVVLLLLLLLRLITVFTVCDSYSLSLL